MQELENIVLQIIEKHPKTKDDFNEAKRQITSKLQINSPSNRNLISAYQNLLKKKRVVKDVGLEFLMRKAEMRTLSGVAIITSLVKPYACPGDCIYCPTEVKMPKSYIATEPAAARALALKFDPYEQMRRRIEVLEQNNHPTDKIEFIIKGGTWNAYPLLYQYWFVLRSFQACNDLSRKNKRLKDYKIKRLPDNHNLSIFQSFNLEDLQNLLNTEQQYNDKKARHKIIGVTLETRPDAISPKTIYHMRQQGCTRIELGLQAPDDNILKLIKRGHTVQQFKDAMYLLRQAGFKVDLHFMPALPGSSAKHDVEMYKQLFSDPGLKPDMIKIYPCTVIKNTELYTWLQNKKYKPYDQKDLFESIIQMKINTPRYCRISRLIRDIPANEIEGGNIITNLREALQSEMKKRGLKCECLRCREVGHVSTLARQHFSTLAPKPFIDVYETNGGTEYFLSFEDSKRHVVFAFLRLRIPNQSPSIFKGGVGGGLLDHLPEMKNSAFIRELHTYGQLLELGEKNKSASQHKGLGKKLVQKAEKIAKKNGYTKLAVISGVGVRGYYRKLGYKKRGTYMVKNIK
ncbi:MAG: tRNA uridine(34) 5-carboxymethylaminomethyl modification radical SAM/GNAT enzyme Elp3 [Candidatus Magasanikbacteria bacterium]